MTGPEGFLALTYFAPPAARGKAEDLYLPQQFVDQVLDEERSDERALVAIGRNFTGLPRIEQVVAGPRTSPNAPCPCGSGRKYKRCCASKPQPAPARSAG